ncbi:hypothetical protein [Dapis sp. BLCC M172]
MIYIESGRVGFMKVINDAATVDNDASQQDAPNFYNTDTTGDDIT